MSGWALVTVLSLLAARGEEGTAEAASLEVRKRAWRPYPVWFYRDHGVDRSCSLDVVLDDRGRPRELTPVDCPPELVRWTTRRVRRDRWERPVVEGTRTRVDVVYRAPVDVVAYPTLDTWRRREGQQCELHVAVQPDGTLAERRGSGCAVTLAPLPPVDPHRLARRVPQVCPLTFLVEDGAAEGFDLFRCPLPLWGYARAALRAWSWPADQRMPWSVILELEGPDPGARAEAFPKLFAPR